MKYIYSIILILHIFFGFKLVANEETLNESNQKWEIDKDALDSLYGFLTLDLNFTIKTGVEVSNNDEIKKTFDEFNILYQSSLRKILVATISKNEDIRIRYKLKMNFDDFTITTSDQLAWVDKTIGYSTVFIEGGEIMVSYSFHKNFVRYIESLRTPKLTDYQFMFVIGALSSN